MIMQNKKIIQWGLLVLSIGFITIGAHRGEVETVLNKAINICLECIGLG